MGTGRVGFLDGIKVESQEENQKRVAEDNMKRQLFQILEELDLENGDTIELVPIAEKIANNIKAAKEDTINRIIQLLKSGNYQFDIDDNGNIRANYSELYMKQKAAEKKGKEEADKILQPFIKMVDEYAKKLERQKIKVTEYTLINCFSKEEYEKHRNWIDIAIFAVLEKRNKETIK